MRSYLFWILSGVQDLFGVSRKQAKGILVLQFLILLMLLSPILFSTFFTKPIVEPSLEDNKLLNDLIAQWEEGEKREDNKQPASESSQIEPSYLPFDPNEVSNNDLVNLGFPGWLAERLIKFRNAGGRFTVKSDIKKVYGLQDWLYNRIEPYIQLPDKVSPEVAENIREKEVLEKNVDTANELYEKPLEDRNLPLLLDINLADSIELQTLRGIGPAFSSRIVKFRNSLGGFVRLEQLKEVYGLSEETYEAIKPLIILNEEFQQKKLLINTSSQAELSAHPYINYATARVLVNYRTQHGPFQSLDDLAFVKVLSDSAINKIAPYLDFTINEDSKR